MSFCKNIFEKGYTIYWQLLHEYWFDKTIAENTYLVGTMESNRHGISKEMVRKNYTVCKRIQEWYDITEMEGQTQCFIY